MSLWRGEQVDHSVKHKGGNLDPNFQKISSGEDIQKALHNSNQDALKHALISLRNQLTMQENENIHSNDDRLLLIRSWLNLSPGGQELFDIWNQASQHNTPLLSLPISILGCLLTLLSTHFIYHSLGLPIIQTLLNSSHMHLLNSYLGGPQPNLILVTLKLFNAMSQFAGSQYQRAVMEGFGWNSKSLPKLLSMRRKNQPESDSDSTKPDIRTLYISFVLSFFTPSTASSIKTHLLEHHADAYTPIFRGLSQDSYPVIHRVLEIAWEGIWSDPKIKRTTKVALFNESTLQHVIKLYERSESEGATDVNNPAYLAHQFLLAICTQPGVGICFRDRGWYPCTSEDIDHETKGKKTTRVYNKILAKILKTLQVGDDPRQQELALRICSACPELVSGYWGSFGSTLEPRLSSKWITTVSFVGAMVSLPIPRSSFLLPNLASFFPSPPPLNIILDNILPKIFSKPHITKGLQSPSSLVQHCTALVLVKCLEKYQSVLSTLREIEKTLEEDEIEGQWTTRRKELEKEFRRRVPDFQVIVAFSQLSRALFTTPTTARAIATPSAISLLTEVSLRLMWLYHRSLYILTVEARFDVGKLVPNLGTTDQHRDPDIEESISAAIPLKGLSAVSQLHVLRLLRLSDQFAWSTKLASSRSHLFHLLELYITSPAQIIQSSSSSLIIHLLANSVLFEHDSFEVQIWLSALPRTRRGPTASSLDDSPLADECTDVLLFLDECIQRCLKTPFRYLEESRATILPTPICSSVDNSYRPNDLPSPLIMTVFDQFATKISSKLLTASATLAVSTFVRKLLLKLVCKQPDLRFTQKMSFRFTAMLKDSMLDFPVIQAGINTEAAILDQALQVFDRPLAVDTLPKVPVVQDFLSQVEVVPFPGSIETATGTAYELVDWLRLNSQPLHVEDLLRLATVIHRWAPRALSEFFWHIHPKWGCFWKLANASLCEQWMSFEWAYINTTPSQLLDEDTSNILSRLLSNETSPARSIMFLAHRLASSGNAWDDTIILGSLRLVTATLKSMSEKKYDSTDIKRVIFIEAEPFRALFISSTCSEAVVAELNHLISTALDPTLETDRMLAQAFCAHWSARIRSSLSEQNTTLNSSLCWVKFLDFETALEYLDITLNTFTPSAACLPMVEEILKTLLSSMLTTSLPTLARFIPRLISLKDLFPDSNCLSQLLPTLLETMLPLNHDGASPQYSTAPSLSKAAENRWKRALVPSSADLAITYHSNAWEESDARTMAAAIYISKSARSNFTPTLRAIDTLPSEHFILPLHAWLDTARNNEVALERVDRFFTPLAKGIFCTNSLKHIQSLRTKCLMELIERYPEKQNQFADSLFSQVSSLPKKNLLSPTALAFLQQCSSFGIAYSPVVEAFVASSLQSLVHVLVQSRDLSPRVVECLIALNSLSIATTDLKPHLVEPVFSISIQNHLHMPAVTDLLSTLAQKAKFKPMDINKSIQMIVQHPQLFSLTSSRVENQDSRESVTRLLDILFHLHPSNTCQITHIAPLISLYSGTLSLPDRRLLSLFRLFETERTVSCAEILHQWPNGRMDPNQAVEALASLDSAMVFRTCAAFPSWRDLSSTEIHINQQGQDDLYDPIFVLLLLGSFLTDETQPTTLNLVKLFRTNGVSLAICAMASRKNSMRNLAFTVLAGIWQVVKIVDFQERDHVTYILDLLRDLLTSPSDMHDCIRLPTYPTLLLAHALRGVFYPSSFVYPLTSRFVLQRPELDRRDVPMLYGLLFSNSDTWKRERGWMIRFLSDGMKATDDWRILKRRYTWDLLASLFQSSTCPATRSGVLDILANITCNRQATTSIIARNGVLPWIEIQMTQILPTEEIAWAKILENIVYIVNPQKVEMATRGEWRASIMRCLEILLEHTDRLELLYYNSRILLRLSLLPCYDSCSNLLDKAVSILRKLEIGVHHMEDRKITGSIPLTTSPPGPCHTHRGLHNLFDRNKFIVWTDCVALLWRAGQREAMAGDWWSALTCRLIAEGSRPESRWARRAWLHAALAS